MRDPKKRSLGRVLGNLPREGALGLVLEIGLGVEVLVGPGVGAQAGEGVEAQRRAIRRQRPR